MFPLNPPFIGKFQLPGLITRALTLQFFGPSSFSHICHNVIEYLSISVLKMWVSTTKKNCRNPMLGLGLPELCSRARLADHLDYHKMVITQIMLPVVKKVNS